MAFIETVINHLKERRVAFAETFAPFYCASLGCHMFNLENRMRGMYFEQGMIPETRMHIMFVAPPGFSKSFLLKQFIYGMHAVVPGNVVRTKFMEVLSGAGFVGTISRNDGQSFKSKGIAEEYADGIIGCEEFAAILNAMQQEHSKDLENTMLTALDGGLVTKRLAGGEIEYETACTLWAGSQPARINLGSGFARRFFFIMFPGTMTESTAIWEAMTHGENIRPNIDEIRNLHRGIAGLKESIRKLKSVSFDPYIWQFLREKKLPHYEAGLFRRFILGHNIVQRTYSTDLHVTLDANIVKAVELAIHWRRQMKMGPEENQVLAILTDLGSTMGEFELKMKLVDWGIPPGRATDLISNLLRDGRVVRNGANLTAVRR